MLRRSFSCSARLFKPNTSVDMKVLPGIKSMLFPVINQSFQSTFFALLDDEFHHNPFATMMLAHIDSLVTLEQCSLRWSPSLAMDFTHQERFKSICFYERCSRTILLPSSPDAYYAIHGAKLAENELHFYRNRDAMYLCMFLHEANHAHDHIVGKFVVNKQDAIALTHANPNTRLFPKLAMWKLDMALSIEYQHADMNDFKEALKKDFHRLNGLMNHSTPGKQEKARHFCLQLRNCLHHYPITDILLEIKSRFIEFSTNGTFGQHFLYDMLPATTHWYLNQYLPNADLKFSAVKRLT